MIGYLALTLAFGTCIFDIFADLVAFFCFLLFCVSGIMYIMDVRIYDSDQHGAGYIRFYFIF